MFMNEARVNLAMIQMYGRAPKSQRAVVARPSKRGQNVSLVNALSLQGAMAPLTILGPWIVEPLRPASFVELRLTV